MSWFYQKKRMFLIRLLQALGFGSVIAYSICSCDMFSGDARPTEYRARIPQQADEDLQSQQNSGLPGSPDNAEEKNPGENQPVQDANANTQNADSAAAPNSEPAPGDTQNADNAIAPNSDPAPGDAQNADSAAAPNADSPTDANANPQNAGNAADPNAKPVSNGAQNANKADPQKVPEPAIRPTEYGPKPEKRPTKYLARMDNR